MAAQDQDTVDLGMTQTERWKILSELDQGADPKIASAKAKLLDGIDKQILTRQRIQVESKQADTNEAVAREYIQQVRKMAKGENFARVETPVDKAGFVLPGDILPGVAVAKGATAVGVATEKYDEFTKRVDEGKDYDDGTQ